MIVSNYAKENAELRSHSMDGMKDASKNAVLTNTNS